MKNSMRRRTTLRSSIRISRSLEDYIEEVRQRTEVNFDALLQAGVLDFDRMVDFILDEREPEGIMTKSDGSTFKGWAPLEREDGGDIIGRIRNPQSYFAAAKTRRHVVHLLARALRGEDVPPDVQRVLDSWPLPLEGRPSQCEMIRISEISLVHVDRSHVSQIQTEYRAGTDNNIGFGNSGSIEGFVESIRNLGLKNPIRVLEIPTVSRRSRSPKFQIIDGARRIAAYRRMGRSRIPALIMEVSHEVIESPP
jgi:hypothetical protein